MDPVAVARSGAVGMVHDRLDPVAHPPGGSGEHGAELPPTEDPERRPRQHRQRPRIQSRGGEGGGRRGGARVIHAAHPWPGGERSFSSTRCVCSSR